MSKRTTQPLTGYSTRPVGNGSLADEIREMIAQIVREEVQRALRQAQVPQTRSVHLSREELESLLERERRRGIQILTEKLSPRVYKGIQLLRYG